jgi:hypothetical protein
MSEAQTIGSIVYFIRWSDRRLGRRFDGLVLPMWFRDVPGERCLSWLGLSTPLEGSTSRAVNNTFSVSLVAKNQRERQPPIYSSSRFSYPAFYKSSNETTRNTSPFLARVSLSSCPTVRNRVCTEQVRFLFFTPVMILYQWKYEWEKELSEGPSEGRIRIAWHYIFCEIRCGCRE